MTLRFAYTRPDGGISIVTAMPKDSLAQVIGEPDKLGVMQLSDGAYRKHVIERSIPEDATNVTELPADWQAPADRTFRNAWKLSGKVVAVDMGKAREIHKGRLRELRAPLLTELDAAYIRADETGDAAAKAEIAARKQALRDITADPAIKAADTPEQLAAAIPEILTADLK